MAITISDVSINRANAFNSESISNVTEHELSFKLAGCSGATTIIISINGFEKLRKIFSSAPSQLYYDIGSFEANVSKSDFKAINVSIIVKDSNKNSAKASTAFSVYKYSPPNVTATVERNSSEQPILKFTPSFQGTVAGATNSLKQFFVRGNNNGTVYTTDLKGKASPQTITGTYDISKSYEFVIFIQDQVRPSSIVKRVTLPSVKLVMDIGADGNTVAFFGEAPESAAKKTLQIGDFASFGETVRLGYASGRNTKIDSGGLIIFNGAMNIAQIGYGNTIDSSGNTVQAPYYTFGKRKDNTEAGEYSFSCGFESSAKGYYSFACGFDTHADYPGSFAGGMGVITDDACQTVVGKYNDSSKDYLFVVGNGENDFEPSNAFGVHKYGHAYVKGDIRIGGGTIYLDDLLTKQQNVICFDGSNELWLGYCQYYDGSRRTVLYGGNEIQFKLSTPQASWKPYYSKGDTVSDLIRTAGFVTNSGKEVQFTIPLSKPVIGNPRVNVTNVDGFCIRQAGKYVYGSTASAYTKASKITAHIAFGGCIVIVATMPNTTNAVNNDTCGVTADLKIAFS